MGWQAFTFVGTAVTHADAIAAAGAQYATWLTVQRGPLDGWGYPAQTFKEDDHAHPSLQLVPLVLRQITPYPTPTGGGWECVLLVLVDMARPARRWRSNDALGV